MKFFAETLDLFGSRLFYFFREGRFDRANQKILGRMFQFNEFQKLGFIPLCDQIVGPDRVRH